VAPYYYYPGWWEGGPMLHFFINTAKWQKLPKNYRAILTAAAAKANVEMQAKYDHLNPGALRKLLAQGAKLRPFSGEILEACFRAANETYAEIGKTNAEFKKIHDAIMAYRNDAFLWEQVTDGTFDNFMMSQQRKKML